jgi:AraC-like DNA-binding protein
MWDGTEVCLVVAVTQLALLALVLLREYREDRSALASVFFMVTIVDHLLVPVLIRHGGPAFLVHAGIPVGAAVPYAFWLLARVHFDDEFRVCPRHGLGLLAFMALHYGAWLVGSGRVAPAPPLDRIAASSWMMGAAVVSMGLMVHALVHVAMGARSDLVVPRVKLRYLVLALSGGYVFLELAAEAVVGERFGPPRFGAQVHAVTTCVLVFCVSVLCLRMRPEVLKPARGGVADVAVLDPALEERLRRLMETERAYREEGLTIVALARRLDAHEHKVRQLINSRLGFRNFNAFLHHFRIQEARKVLADPAQSHLGVAQVAFQVGYRSLGPFNKAFKELTGLTPTEFRTARQNEAAAAPPPRARASGGGLAS